MSCKKPERAHLTERASDDTCGVCWEPLIDHNTLAVLWLAIKIRLGKA